MKKETLFLTAGLVAVGGAIAYAATRDDAESEEAADDGGWIPQARPTPILDGDDDIVIAYPEDFPTINWPFGGQEQET